MDRGAEVMTSGHKKVCLEKHIKVDGNMYAQRCMVNPNSLFWTLVPKVTTDMKALLGNTNKSPN